MKRYCLSEHPEKVEIGEHNRSGFCQNCNGMFAYHRRKGIANFRRYKGRMALAASRIEHLPDVQRPTLRVVQGGRKHGT